ncbi:CopD family protein [Methylophilaceae bacterium]|jgi:protoporphyrinogen IX oxidase|nr:CopD family protein [Methylophilaceae bacterium]
MLWIKSFHIIFMVTWFAGLFYLPRLFVYHAMTTDKVGHDRFVIMERKLFYGIMTPGALLTIISGVWLWFDYNFFGLWLNLKLFCVILLIFYHCLCLKHLINFRNKKNKRGHVYFRWFNEFPVILLILIVILVVIKPL